MEHVRIIRNYKCWKPEIPIALAIGNFDGLHLGHREIFKTLVQVSIEYKITPVVMTFHPHPRDYFKLRKIKENCLFRLRDKIKYLSAIKINYLLNQFFSKDFSSISADDFVKKVLIDHLHVKLLVVGKDWAFGKGRAGSLEELIKLVSNLPIKIIVVDDVCFNGKKISTTRIRELLSQGVLEEVNECLGRKYAISGFVVRGEGRGRKIGFPTANIDLILQQIPQNGVYLTRFKSSEVDRLSVTNIGLRPTFNFFSKQTVEAHLLDFDGDLYGKECSLEFISRIRDERKFDSVEMLVEQIKKDISTVAASLKNSNLN